MDKKLPFNRWGFNTREDYRERKAGLKKEKAMVADDIFPLLAKKLRNAGFLITSERSAGGSGMRPFDLIAGEEESFTIIGFEIKSDRDTFDRLMSQLYSYSKVCDQVYLVLHKKEAPKLLPSRIGVIRVFNDGYVAIEEHATTERALDIGSYGEWNAILKANGLSLTSDRTANAMNIIDDVRRNVLFNRFFANFDYCRSPIKVKKFYPLTEKHKKILIGFDVPEYFKVIKKEYRAFEKKVALLKETIEFGSGKQKKLKVKI